jgi:hypothetical protein
VSPDPQHDFPEPWQDPEFAPALNVGRFQKAGPAAGPGGRRDLAGGSARRRSPLPLWIPALVLAALFAGFLFDPMIGPVIRAALAGVGVTLAVLLGAMALGMAGSGLFSIGDRVIAWIRRSSRWPEE